MVSVASAAAGDARERGHLVELLHAEYALANSSNRECIFDVLVFVLIIDAYVTGPKPSSHTAAITKMLTTTDMD